jgi:hypothetical protein
VLGTYASAALILVAAALVGQAVFVVAGRRRWSWLSPAVGLALLTALAWGTVRLSEDGTVALIAVAIAALCSLALLRGRTEGVADALRIGAPVAMLGLLAASLPFIVEGRFGILGTGLNPDMSQHLFAADRLLSGDSERLVDQGYPLGPHALVVSIAGPSGIGLVQAFDGFMLAISASAVLAALAALEGLDTGRRLLGALLVGLPYMAASFLIQGAFKETLEAMFVLAFAIGLHGFVTERGHEVGGGSAEPPQGPIRGRSAGRRSPPLAALPLAALAIGAVYSYSFPGLLWLGGALGVWAVAEVALAAKRGSARAALELVRPAAPAALLGLTVVAIAIAPEAGRMSDFAEFETFDPDGPGLGNLFNPISPLEALGIWFSGDFRLDPGDGAVPASIYWVGGAVAVAALAYGAWWWLRRRELAVPAALGAAGLLYLYTVAAGTPYQESKAIAIAAPLAMLVAARPLLAGTAASGDSGRRPAPALTGLALAFLGAATGCSVLALVNGPVGPAGYSPTLAGLRPDGGKGSTLVLAPRKLLADEHGRDYLVWELRGARICVEEARGPSDEPPPDGVARVITEGWAEPPFTGLELEKRAGRYQVWKRRRPPAGAGPCPFIPAGARANPADD